VFASAALLVIAPVLFGTVFKHKFNGGLEILPFALVACIWTSMAALMHNYLWCAEKAQHTSLSLAAGLGMNIVLNLLLLPVLGLYGVAIASAASKAASLVLLLWIAAKYDWKPDRGLILIALLPLLLPLGPWLTMFVAALAVLGFFPTMPFLRADECETVAQLARQNYDRLRRLMGRVPRENALPS